MTDAVIFLLFAGPDYYPRGGPQDFISSHDSIEDAQRSVPSTVPAGCFADAVGWAQIATFNGTTLSIVASAPVPGSHACGGPLKWTDGNF